MEILSYDLNLDVDFAEAVVEGTSVLRIVDSENPLILDAVDMEVEAVKVNGVPCRSKLDRKKGKLRIPGVPGGKSTVEVHFSKHVADGTIFGLYKSKYNGNYMLVTDLEPAEARTVFPCKDEPAYKAVFKLTVVTERNLKVISNSTERSVEQAPNGRLVHIFNPSPRMSTYIFFLGIGDFEESVAHGGRTKIISASRPGTSKDATFALEIASRVLKDYEKYFGIPYPLPKLHLVGLPEYHTGAMENWGAITAREAYVVVEKGASLFDIRRAAFVIAHEIAHMWFGDLVTMKWWDDLWLNESFAAFMEHKVLDRVHPEWDIWRDFLMYENFPSMNADSLAATHPIQVEVRTVNEIQQVFDAISYGKGASILRMIEAYVGEAAFRRGVSNYLRRFRYSNAKGEDLWKSVAKTSGKPVSKVMGAWVRQPGFPVVKVSTEGGAVKLSQSRLLASGKESRSRWPIPLTYQADGKLHSVLFEGPTMTIGGVAGSGFLVNPAKTGFYAVLYDDEAYEAMARRFHGLHPHDRAALMSDLWLFLQAQKVKPETYFRFLSLCGRYPDAILAQTATGQLGNLRAIADEARVVRKAYEDFSLPMAGLIGLAPKNGEDPNLGTARETLMAQVVQVNREYAEKLSGRFADFDAVEPDLKLAVATAYSVVNGGSAYEPMVARLREAGEVDRAKLYAALTASGEPSVVEKTLDLSIGGEVSRSDSGYTIVGASNNPNARETTWAWITSHYDEVKGIYGGAQQFYLYLDRVIPRCGLGRVDEVASFLSGRRYEDGKLTFRRTFERLDINSRLREKLLSV